MRDIEIVKDKNPMIKVTDLDLIEEEILKTFSKVRQHTVFAKDLKLKYNYKIIANFNQVEMSTYYNWTPNRYMLFKNITALNCKNGEFAIKDDYLFPGQIFDMSVPTNSFIKAVAMTGVNWFDIKNRTLEIHFHRRTQKSYRINYLATLNKVGDNKYEVDRVMCKHKQ